MYNIQGVVLATVLTIASGVSLVTVKTKAPPSIIKTCRSPTVVAHFKKATVKPFPEKGVVDHICPLAAGGNDTLNNLQWQTIPEGHKKDLIERTVEGIAFYCNPTNAYFVLNKPVRHVYNCKKNTILNDGDTN